MKNKEIYKLYNEKSERLYKELIEIENQIKSLEEPKNRKERKILRKLNNYRLLLENEYEFYDEAKWDFI